MSFWDIDLHYRQFFRRGLKKFKLFRYIVTVTRKWNVSLIDYAGFIKKSILLFRRFDLIERIDVVIKPVGVDDSDAVEFHLDDVYADEEELPIGEMSPRVTRSRGAHVQKPRTVKRVRLSLGSRAHDVISGFE